jgi:hypothetical protein
LNIKEKWVRELNEMRGGRESLEIRKRTCLFEIFRAFTPGGRGTFGGMLENIKLEIIKMN